MLWTVQLPQFQLLRAWDPDEVTLGLCLHGLTVRSKPILSMKYPAPLQPDQSGCPLYLGQAPARYAALQKRGALHLGMELNLDNQYGPTLLQLRCRRSPQLPAQLRRSYPPHRRGFPSCLVDNGNLLH